MKKLEMQKPKEKMVRLYGNAPYKIVLVHGGPGAIGSLKGFAKELSERSGAGVVEAIQSKYSIVELIEELYGQIKENCAGKVLLTGHSWGAWLAALFTQAHPDLVQSIVLVGCPPLEDKYIPQINIRRKQNLQKEDKEIFERLAQCKATDRDMQRIPKALERSDNYCLTDKELHQADQTDKKMHNAVWKEAAGLRSGGEILASFRHIQSKIYLIQGVTDPHPIEGITVPLGEAGVPCQVYALEKCGHSPFMEKYAKDEFYGVLTRIIEEM